jgi:thymidine phosphorylase
MNETDESNQKGGSLVTVRRLGIDTRQEPVIYLRADSPVCRAEGFEAQTRVEVCAEDHTIVATLNMVQPDTGNGTLIASGEAGLSEVAWRRLGVQSGATVRVSHANPVSSLGYVRAKVYGHRLSDENFRAICRDIVEGRWADVHIAAFLAACGGERLHGQEVASLSRAMRDVGETLDWGRHPVMDKHCVGGLPGNRTTPLVVSIVAAHGLCIPKTSSRAITSPAGTADTMAVLTRVDLSQQEIRDVVEAEGGCFVWGGRANLSPADEILNRVERALDLDSEGQMVASVLSKKAAAGSSDVLIDIPVGRTAKVRSDKAADSLTELFEGVADGLEMSLRVVRTDGAQPVGRGIGPALEARDVLAVLRREDDAPADLAERSVLLAGELLEMGGVCQPGEGQARARKTLRSGEAFEKFRAICRAQGGLKEPPTSAYQVPIEAPHDGVIKRIDNRRLAKVAKLAGAPEDAAAGLDLHIRIGDAVTKGEPLYTIHADSEGEREYALDYLAAEEEHIISMEEQT